MKTNKVFKPYMSYPNKLDKLFVWLVDEADVSTWYDGSDKWDDVITIYDAHCYNSGMYLSLDENKRFKKLCEETIGKREFEQRKKKNYEEFIDSIGVD